MTLWETSIKNNFFKALIFSLVLGLYSVAFFGHDAIREFRGEDNLIQNLGAFFFFMASILYFASYLQSSGMGKDSRHLPAKRNIYYLFLALLFFIGFGEEISWGQRIFGWETPQFMKEINLQGETNFHNIRMFDNKGQWGKDKTPVLSLFLNVTTWFFLFWFFYCLILPLLNRYSPRFRGYLTRFNLPLPPIWIGLLLLVNFSLVTIPHLASLLGRMDHSMHEVSETNYAFIFAVLSFHELKKQLLIKKAKLKDEKKNCL